MINRKNMMDCICQQLAIDYNCSLDDFFKDGLIFTEARENEGRRHFPFVTPRLEMISMGHGTIINVSSDILPYIRHEFEGKTREEVFNGVIIPNNAESTLLKNPIALLAPRSLFVFSGGKKLLIREWI